MPPAVESGSARARRAAATLLLGCLFTLLYTISAVASGEFSPSSIVKGVLLVASPTLDDPNFHQTVVLIVEHGSAGTLGLVLNRSTKVLLSEALPDLTVLKGTPHRLFAGGPVELTRLLMLFRLKEPTTEAQAIFDGVYVGGSPEILQRILKQGKPTETFRAFAGYAGWGPRQLEYEMLQGSWAVLPPDASGIFDTDPATLWPDSIGRLQKPSVVSR